MGCRGRAPRGVETCSPGSWGKGLKGETFTRLFEPRIVLEGATSPPLPSLPPGHRGGRKQAPRRGSRIDDCLSELSQAGTPGSNGQPLATHERSDATLPAVTRVPDDSASGPVSPEISGLTGTGSCKTNLGNDPSAGSPTETLLRLLLPLNDQV